MKNPEIRMRFDRKYFDRLQEMAKEAEMRPSELAGSLIRAVLDDDAKAHGRPLDQHNQ